MENNKPLQAEEMLEKIFYYMNQLIEEKEFIPTIRLLTDLGRTLVNAERASFWYWDRAKKEYWTLAALGSERIIVPEGSGIVGASIQNKETIVINNPYEDTRFNPQVDKDTGYTTKSILCLPVTNARGKVIGAYQAINKIGADGQSVFDEQDVKHLTFAAVFCGKTLESHILYEETQLDPLTHLKNRRGFDEYYSEISKDRSEDETAVLIMCDIDFFKQVNDNYGHNAGDAVLVSVAELLKTSVAGNGQVARWGGEEFVMLLRNCTETTAMMLAEKIRKEVEQTVCEFEESQIHITMSFGVRELESGLNMQENVEKVDARLYQAKTSGRNRVVAS